MDHAVNNHASPIIAVLTEITLSESNEPTFGRVHGFCEELCKLVIDSGGLFYVFSLKDFTIDGILGFHFEGGSWKKSKLPFPDVIYNRIPSRKTERGKRYSAFLELSKKLDIKVFNHRFLTKWEVHEWLSKKKNLQPFLPDTCLYSKKSLRKMLTLYPEVFIKPLSGSQGRGIIRITTQKDQLLVSFSSQPEAGPSGALDIEDLISLVQKKVGNQLYLIQQGIPLLGIEDRVIDIRVLCHRGTKEKWKVTSVVGRLSAENHFTANLARGGEIVSPLKILSAYFNRKAGIQKLRLLKELALEAADCISENAPGLIAELGIDIGVDVDGNLWVIEANSKPSKNFEQEASKIRPSAKAIIAYCHSLFSRQSGAEGGDEE
ncbi:YheC/YheD family protein [Mesobacillus foraminis]|uniref:YheC/YheD family endospore coat-associated protein n=1 Tax=Mesobacillus foraminis TaxID=279826 RepID=UPI0039A21F1B